MLRISDVVRALLTGFRCLPSSTALVAPILVSTVSTKPYVPDSETFYQESADIFLVLPLPRLPGVRRKAAQLREPVGFRRIPPQMSLTPHSPKIAHVAYAVWTRSNNNDAYVRRFPRLFYRLTVVLARTPTTTSRRSSKPARL